jgi:hypothetical protein
MLRLKYLITACVLVLGVGTANADVFTDFTFAGTTAAGPFSGTYEC